MVNIEAPSCLPRLSHSIGIATSSRESLQDGQQARAKLFERTENTEWAGSRENPLASGRGGAFFLTSLFIELIDPDLNKKTSQSRSVLGRKF